MTLPKEANGTTDDAQDGNFVPDVTLSDHATSGLPSLPPLGGVLPPSPPSSDAASSPSKKRKSGDSDLESGPRVKRSNSGKNPSRTKSARLKEVKLREVPPPHGRPLVWAEVIFRVSVP